MVGHPGPNFWPPTCLLEQCCHKGLCHAMEAIVRWNCHTLRSLKVSKQDKQKGLCVDLRAVLKCHLNSLADLHSQFRHLFYDMVLIQKCLFIQRPQQSQTMYFWLLLLPPAHPTAIDQVKKIALLHMKICSLWSWFNGVNKSQMQTCHVHYMMEKSCMG